MKEVHSRLVHFTWIGLWREILNFSGQQKIIVNKRNLHWSSKETSKMNQMYQHRPDIWDNNYYLQVCIKMLLIHVYIYQIAIDNIIKSI